MRACRFKASTTIDRAAFDEMQDTLCITFRGTGKYVYYDVPEPIFEAMCDAESVGAFFNERIKGHFRCARDPDRRRFGPTA